MEQWVTVKEAAQILGKSEGTIRAWYRAGKIRTKRDQLSNIVYVDLTEIRQKQGELPTA